MLQMKLCRGLIVFHLPPKTPRALPLEIAPIASAASEVDRAKLLHHQLPPRTAPAQFAFPVRTANNLDLGIIFKSIFSVSHSWSHVKIYGSFFSFTKLLFNTTNKSYQSHDDQMSPQFIHSTYGTCN